MNDIKWKRERKEEFGMSGCADCSTLTFYGYCNILYTQLTRQILLDPSSIYTSFILTLTNYSHTHQVFPPIFLPLYNNFNTKVEIWHNLFYTFQSLFTWAIIFWLYVREKLLPSFRQVYIMFPSSCGVFVHKPFIAYVSCWSLTLAHYTKHIHLSPTMILSVNHHLTCVDLFPSL